MRHNCMLERIHAAATAARFIVLLAAAVVACNAANGQSKTGAQPAAGPIPVIAQRVVVKDIERALEYVGDIKGQDEAMVYPKVNGKIIEKLKEDGATVEKGETIAYVDRDEVGQKFEKAPVESPLSGVIGRTYVDRGTSVGPQTPVAMVVNMDRVKVTLDIPEKYLPQISVGTIAQVGVDGYARAFTGAVSKVSPVLDAQTRTAPVEILLPNSDHALKPGMFARVRVIVERKQRVRTVAKESVLGKAPDEYVYVVQNGAARQRKVKIGLLQAGDREVVEGLEEGETVVIMGQQRLKDNSEVTVEER